MKNNTSKDSYNEYLARGNEIGKLIDGRYTQSQQQAEWVYDKEVKQITSRNKYKYQDVIMSHKIGFREDMKQIIFDQKAFPDDLAMFSTESRWKLVGFEQMEYEVPDKIPSASFMAQNGISSEVFDNFWGKVQMQGRMGVKLSETGYNVKHFNLRKRCITFYPHAQSNHTTQQQPQRHSKQQFMIPFNQTTFNYQSETEDYFALKTGERIVKIKKDGEGKQAVRAIERMLFLCSFRGAYCIRNEVPSQYVSDYVIKEIDTIKGVDFVHEHKNKDIVSSRYYRQAISGFFYLLNKAAFKRKTLALEITYPKWLKPQYSVLPTCDLNAVTNVIPKKNPLMNLKIKLHDSEIALLNENLKYIFPFRREFAKRSLIVYQSNLQDNHVNYMMNQISYPMFMIGLPKNQLSLLGLEYVINAAGTLSHQCIDFSYNSKLISISGNKLFTLTNANPSLKKLTLKGCYVALGQQGQFFQGLASNMCLKEFEIDYMDSYNDAMIKHMDNYDAELY